MGLGGTGQKSAVAIRKEKEDGGKASPVAKQLTVREAPSESRGSCRS
jgi:hypothetical protein